MDTQPKYSKTPPNKIFGLYRAQWITPDGESQWITVGYNERGFQWMGNEISKPSPTSIYDFVCWFGPDIVWGKK